MLEHIKKYQCEYINLLKQFKKKKRDYDEYLLLFDKVELLLKKTKK